MDKFDIDREWSQAELREHLRKEGFPVDELAEDDTIPQCIKLAAKAPLDAATIRWANSEIKRLRLTPPEAPPTGPVLSAPRMEDVIHELRAALAQRDARIAELERDRERLDWLEKNQHRVALEGSGAISLAPAVPIGVEIDWNISYVIQPPPMTLRAAIDAAMKEPS